MNSLADFIGSKNDQNIENQLPWFEISLQVIDSNIEYHPRFEISEFDFSIWKVIEILIKDCVDICINIQRVDTGGVGDYLVEMRGDFSIRYL